VALADVLSQVMAVQVESDGALTVRHDGTVASLREVSIAEGLDMLSLTQVLAWDLPVDVELRKRVAEQANTTLLGTVTMSGRQGDQADVMLRYNFPVGGLSDQAVQTLVLMVLSGGADVRRALLG
jgi:hypothetical protein